METYSPFSRSARYYDLLYRWRDYEQEAATIRQLVKTLGHSGGSDLLDVACGGTGGHLKVLQQDFQIVGIDISPEMLAQARSKLPSASLVGADMADFDLHRQFDVILCLFASIEYVGTRDRLISTIRNFSKHSKPGGLVVVEPLAKSRLVGIQISSGTLGSLSVQRSCKGNEHRSRVEFRFSIYHLEFQICDRSAFSESHHLAAFDRDDILSAMKEFGLAIHEVDHSLTPGHSLYVGTKR